MNLESFHKYSELTDVYFLLVWVGMTNNNQNKEGKNLC